jgi:hypothetical protein
MVKNKGKFRNHFSANLWPALVMSVPQAFF